MDPEPDSEGRPRRIRRANPNMNRLPYTVKEMRERRDSSTTLQEYVPLEFFHFHTG